MHTDVIVALISIAPSVLATISIVIFVVIFRKAINERLLPRLTGLKIFGLEVTLKETLDEVVAGRSVQLSEGDKWNVLKRAQHILPVIKGAQILWVDDQPQQNKQLIKILFSLGAEVSQAQNSDEALKLLHRHQYHLVISDITRQGNDKAGLEMLERMQQEGVYRQTIFYVFNLKQGIPKYAFNITNRPDYLLHYVMDILERERWGFDALI